MSTADRVLGWIIVAVITIGYLAAGYAILSSHRASRAKRARRTARAVAVVAEPGSTYTTATEIVRTGRCTWAWTVALHPPRAPRFPRPATVPLPERVTGLAFTETGARRRAARTAARMLDAAHRQTTITTHPDGTTTEQP
ncbi:hypothetical protein [Streptomyces sp. NPDC093093]|uniref:hypothetical protein n=1 Tax=Streptomyces sp. NPDC093093 TaxID=3366025 RepID=UPI003800A925